MEGVFQVRKFAHQTAASNALLVFDFSGWQLAGQEPIHPENADNRSRTRSAAASNPRGER